MKEVSCYLQYNKLCVHPSHRPVTQELVHPKQVAGWYLAGQTKRWLTTRSGQKSRHYLVGKGEMVSRKKKEEDGSLRGKFRPPFRDQHLMRK